MLTKTATLVAAGLVLSSFPSFAAQIVQNLPAIEAGVDAGPFDIYGQGFDQNAGTLTSVMAELKGIYTASIYTPHATLVPTSVPSNVVYDIDPFDQNAALYGTATTLILTELGNGLSGSTPIDVSGFFSNLSFFESVGLSVTSLADFGVYSGLPNFGLGASSDSSQFTGTLVLTYNYTPVPEPSSFGLLAIAALVLSICKSGAWRRWLGSTV